MGVLKIGIVEDELIIAGSIISTLEELGYSHSDAAISYSEALVMLEEEQPDLLLLDINLSGKKDGIEVAEYVNEKYGIPFIFLTANSDIATIERAKKVKPHAYLVKPFNKEELFAAIEIAFSNYSAYGQKKPEPAGVTRIKDALFIRNKQSFTKIRFSEIAFLESNENYVFIHVADGRKLMQRATLTDFLTQLPEGQFYRTHRSYAVRIDCIEKIEEGYLIAGGKEVPLGKDRVAGLFEILGIRG